ncbi:sulfur oxidation c-type cytochrome SoxA [Fretibacter rubidus]|uniref:sulfur oxidation c-type cytochrome SoxA n=1 Tax=Fretibacter rubidus TaxID=570162 RepID=UPI00352A6A64
MRIFWVIFALWLAACSPKSEVIEDAFPTPIKSGYAFLTADTQALQDDDFSNPGLLWAERGAAMFAQDCQACHSADAMTGIAATFPKMKDGKLINLEGQINQCRVELMNTTPLPYESDALLSLTTFVANKSKGLPISVDITGPAAEFYSAGRDYFYTRRGQFNLSCAQCHNNHWGQKLRGDTVSQGHGNGFPAYRFEWESVGSLHRRLSDCDLGVRAEPRALGSDDYLNLELYLAARAQGLTVETPAVRR